MRSVVGNMKIKLFWSNFLTVKFWLLNMYGFEIKVKKEQKYWIKLI